MPSIFAGLNISKLGLFAQQRALHTISHNIANANTEGYSRQTVNLNATNPEALSGNGFVGTGVEAQAVQQIRNEFLDYSYRGENSKFGHYEVYDDVLKNIEGILKEPSDASFSKLMDNYYASMQELNKNPESLTVRALVRQRGVALAEGIKSMSDALKKMQMDVNFELGVAVTDMNGYAQQIATLNKLIYNQELDGAKANDIRDQRNLLVDKMSKLAKVEYYEDPQGRFIVNVNGNSVVNHYEYDQIVTTARTVKNNEDDVENIVDLKWKSGASFRSSEGKIPAIIEMRDNNAGANKGIPYYVDKLNEFIDTLASEINNIHSGGFGLDKSTGINFFTSANMTTKDYNAFMLSNGLNGGSALDVTSQVLKNINTTIPTTPEIQAQNAVTIRENMNAILKGNSDYNKKSVKLIDGRYYITDRLKSDNITISKDIDLDLNKLAAADNSNTVPGKGANALKIATSRNNVKLFDWGSPDDFVKSLVSNLAVDKSEATRVFENQTTILKQLTVNRESSSGVSLDEEMADMMRFQHAYNANARVMTTFDEMIDTLVNKVGTVGR